ncbi:MAG TPA: TraR/DksA C4-type zinc finger protein [Candidatus Udaeobacter sp.]|nr:TraR/DksA C4-type zinc finger protein [Candidatus Udaeobacter sp.]
MAKSKKKKNSAASSAGRKRPPIRKLQARKATLKNSAREKKTVRRSAKPNVESTESPAAVLLGLNHREKKLDPFIRKQKQNLLQLRDAVVDSMAGVAQGTLRSRAEGSEASAFGMHQADAGSDAYDRDFALSLLSQEQDALYEIDEALKRIELGSYGKCEMSGKPIPRARLEAIPFARFTVECQSQLEKQSRASRVRPSVTSLFGLTEEEGGESEEEEASPPEVKE